MALTFATSETSQRIPRHVLEVRTNTGVKVDSDRFPDLDIEQRSAASLVLDVPLPDTAARELLVRVRDGALTVRIPVPEQDGTIGWQPAPLRQVAPAPTILRSPETEVAVDSVRTEGLITEVALRGTGLSRQLSLCTTASQCSLTEPDGTIHPLLGTNEDAREGVRLSTVLRFLGEIGPDSSKLTLAIRRDHSTRGSETIDLDLPSHAESRVRVAAGDLSRSATDMAPVEVTDPTSQTTLRATGVDVLADHVQVHVTIANNGQRPYYLDRSLRQATELREPGGFVHPLAVGKEVNLTVEPGETMEATLVFRGSVPADVTALTLVTANFSNQESITAALTIPTADTTDDSEPTTFADLGEVAQDATPTVAATPAPTDPTATAQPTVASLRGTDVVGLPVTSSSVTGAVHSTVVGQGTAPKVASGEEVDPKAEAEAQRSLKDLGAEKTPDGYVLTLPETVLFDYNKADLKAEASGTIDKVAKLLAYYDKAKIGVLGHTDSTGDAQGNQDLSKRRAQAVADALAGGGVSASRMTVEGFAATQPVASNGDDAGRAKNRRVEIVLRENA